ncbi:unnamed protein product [Gongylonema pulchrum]|uniref:YTH domain-containing protein n=1 Tax=Gongylonema pulchrum TaxID=637853 RepID=A0A183ERB3_9BILA|nr:unnamed protein product [Gongylonema pulchrum]
MVNEEGIVEQRHSRRYSFVDFPSLSDVNATNGVTLPGLATAFLQNDPRVSSPDEEPDEGQDAANKSKLCVFFFAQIKTAQWRQYEQIIQRKWSSSSEVGYCSYAFFSANPALYISRYSATAKKRIEDF